MPLERPTLGVERFIQAGLAQAGGRRIGGRGSQSRPGATYRSGWAKGLTQDQATEKARTMYSGLRDTVRRKYEKQAQMLDVVSQRERGILERPTAPEVPRPGGGARVQPLATPTGRVEAMPSAGGMADMPSSPSGRPLGESVSPVERPSLRNPPETDGQDTRSLMPRSSVRDTFHDADERPRPSLREMSRQRQARMEARQM